MRELTANEQALRAKGNAEAMGQALASSSYGDTLQTRILLELARLVRDYIAGADRLYAAGNKIRSLRIGSPEMDAASTEYDAILDRGKEIMSAMRKIIAILPESVLDPGKQDEHTSGPSVGLDS